MKPNSDASEKKERIAKIIAASGIASRREAERLIAQNRVSLNNRIVDTPATLVAAGDKITIDGKLIPGKPATRLWRFHKPVGYLVSRSDPEGRPTIYEILPPKMQSLHYIGRLDMNSEGLLLLTNDPDLKREMESPSLGLPREYLVRVRGTPSDRALQTMRGGIEIDGFRYLPVIAEIDRITASNCWLSVTLTEGKNREIRRIFEHLGHPVSRLIRVAYGDYTLGDLREGEFIEVIT
jgi:23S rRNA pseudouridine2605 synthase